MNERSASRQAAPGATSEAARLDRGEVMADEEKRARDARRVRWETWFAVGTGTMNGLLLNGMKSIGCPLSVEFRGRSFTARALGHAEPR
jgi:hypothetical protein